MDPKSEQKMQQLRSELKAQPAPQTGQAAAAPASPAPAQPQPATPMPVAGEGGKGGKKGLLVFGLILLFLGLVAGGAYFGYQYVNQGTGETVESTSPTPEVTPTPTPTLEASPTAEPSPSEEATIEGTIYENSEYGFSIVYPDEFEVKEDSYGWPKAVLILYSGGQSYDLVVEVWDTKAEYLTKYSSEPADRVVVKEVGGKFVTLLNNNQTTEVADVIATFSSL